MTGDLGVGASPWPTALQGGRGLGHLRQNDGLLRNPLLPTSVFSHGVIQTITNGINVLMALKCQLLRTDGQSRGKTEGLGDAAEAQLPWILLSFLPHRFKVTQ